MKQEPAVEVAALSLQPAEAGVVEAQLVLVFPLVCLWPAEVTFIQVI